MRVDAWNQSSKEHSTDNHHPTLTPAGTVAVTVVLHQRDRDDLVGGSHMKMNRAPALEFMERTKNDSKETNQPDNIQEGCCTSQRQMLQVPNNTI